MSDVSESIPSLTQYTRHTKIEETAQGIRLHCSIFANDNKTAVDELFSLYQMMIDKANERHDLRAPMEIKEKKPIPEHFSEKKK